jgi:hypothetical protein
LELVLADAREAGLLGFALRFAAFFAGVFVCAGVFAGFAARVPGFFVGVLARFAGGCVARFVLDGFLDVLGAIGSLEMEGEEHVFEFIDVLADLKHVLFERFEMIARFRVVRCGANELFGRIVQPVDLATNTSLKVAQSAMGLSHTKPGA